jgi:hypothetical protein
LSRDSQIALAFGVVLVVALIVVGLGPAGTTSTTTSHGPGSTVPEPPADGSAGEVFDLRMYGGLSVLGIHLSSPTREAHVGMIVPLECILQDASGAEELRDSGICADLPARGEVTGGGTTPGGGRLVFVRVDVSKPCFETLTIGERWPPGIEACAAH